MKKKILGVVLAAVMCISTSLVAFAEDQAWKHDIPGYGTLWGWLEGINDHGYYVETKTEVSENPDGAILRVHIDMYASDGSVLHTDWAESDSGETYFHYNFPVNNFAGVSSVYCAHEVVKGSIYPAEVVYTSVHDLPDLGTR